MTQEQLPPEPGTELNHDSDDVEYPVDNTEAGNPNESAETEDDEGEGPTEE